MFYIKRYVNAQYKFLLSMRTLNYSIKDYMRVYSRCNSIRSITHLINLIKY